MRAPLPTQIVSPAPGVFLAAGEGFESSLTDPETVVVRTKPNHSTTTYERGSTGIHNDLTTSPQNKKLADESQTGPNGSPRTHRTYRYESEGRRFESCLARPSLSCKSGVYLLPMSPLCGVDHFGCSKAALLNRRGWFGTPRCPSPRSSPPPGRRSPGTPEGRPSASPSSAARRT